MPALAERDFQGRPLAGRMGRSLYHISHDRLDIHVAHLDFHAPRSVALVSPWISSWHDSDQAELQTTPYWGFADLGWDHLRAWRAPNNDDLRSYSLSLFESFRIATREYSSIEIDPGIMSGAPCVAGTRIPVYMILDAIAYHGSPEGVLESYPSLTLDQVKDAIGFAKIVVECPLADDEP